MSPTKKDEALRRAAEQFAFYARVHWDKDTPESHAKALVNDALAKQMREALAAKPGE